MTTTITVLQCDGCQADGPVQSDSGATAAQLRKLARAAGWATGCGPDRECDLCPKCIGRAAPHYVPVVRRG